MGAALRAVGTEERGDRKKGQYPRSRTPIATAARSGNRRRLLVTLRDAISKQLDEGVHPRDMVGLSRRLMELAAEIAEIDAEEQGDEVSNAADTPDEAWSPTS